MLRLAAVFWEDGEAGCGGGESGEASVSTATVARAVSEVAQVQVQAPRQNGDTVAGRVAGGSRVWGEASYCTIMWERKGGEG